MNIKELPVLERPREKALHFGIEKLSDYELLAVLIGSGSSKDSALDIAYKMISDNHGLFHLVQKPMSDLLNYEGIGESKAVKIIAAFELAKRYNSLQPQNEKEKIDNNFIYKKYKNLLSHTCQEFLFLIILDKKKRIIHEVNLYKGSESNLVYSKKQIIREVLIHQGSYFYVVHNHPSGNLFPSEEDIVFTTEIIHECQKMELTLIDHLIVTSRGYFSFQSAETYLEPDIQS